jgi:hypothetical protein
MWHRTSLFVTALCIFGATSYAKYTDRGAAPVAAESAPAPVGVSQQEKARFARAVRLYRAGQYSAAYGRFVELADGGHRYAAAISLQMLRNGPYLYRSEWSATPAQVAHWQRVSGVLAPLEVAVFGE